VKIEGRPHDESDAAAQAAVFGLDPIKAREEYAALSGILAAGRKGEALISGLDALMASENPDVRQLALRAANLGLLNWSIWSGGQGRSLVEELEAPTSRCLVVDLGSLNTINEQRLIAETVLSTLWRNRARRDPCLVVIDEAHNVCPSKPADPVTELATNYAALIAAEGRKFGLYLLTSTQRPQKVNEEVLTQSDNLLLMRMNSDADLEYLCDLAHRRQGHHTRLDRARDVERPGQTMSRQHLRDPQIGRMAVVPTGSDERAHATVAGVGCLL